MICVILRLIGPCALALLVLSLPLYSKVAYATDCLHSDIQLTSQDAVDDFQANYGGGEICDVVTGTLRIGSSTDIVNLDGLRALIRIEGHLQIDVNFGLADISGLAALSDVGDDLVIHGNGSLLNLNGLSALEHVGGNLRLDGNGDLSSISGLSGLVSVGGDLVISITSLLNLQGLENLERVGGHLKLDENHSLSHVSGLAALSSIGGDLVVSRNRDLLDLNGLTALQSIGGSLVLSTLIPWVTNLEDIGGLSALTSIGGDLIIEGSQLRTINGLENLTRINGEVRLYWNSRLENVEAFRNLAEVGSNFTLSRSYYLDSTDGLRNLTRVDGDMELSLLNNLADVDGLSSLTSVGGKLRISHNDALSNLDGLSSVHDVESLAINANNSLGDCLGVVRLVDMFDDFEQGPGPQGSPMPDVEAEAMVTGNAQGCNSIGEILGSVPLVGLNPGLNDAWFNPATDGQGFFIVVFPSLSQVFLSWFTYDIERPAEDVIAFLGEPGHRWLTAQGEYANEQARLVLWQTRGGIFDSGEPAPEWLDDGELVLEFTTCDSGTIYYDIDSINKQGSIPIERIAPDNVALCYALNASPHRFLRPSGNQ